MQPKKILVVSISLHPEISPRSFRTTELVKELSKQGHMVIVYTFRDEAVHPQLEKEYGIVIKNIGVNKNPVPATGSANRLSNLFNRAMRRILLQLFEYPDIQLMFLIKKCLRTEQGYDMLISVAFPYPVHWGVAKAIQKNKKLAGIWVADCGDPYMGNKADSFKKLFYFKYVEEWFCRKANYIAVPTEGSIDAYYPEFKHKIKVIPQGFNFNDTPVYNGIIKNEVPTFAYAGMFIPGIRDPKEMLDFLCTLQQPFKFIIYTAQTALVAPYAEISANRIEIRSYIPRPQLIYELSKMDFLVNFTNGTTTATPSKLIDYAITKRPVLTVDTGKLNKENVQAFLKADYSNQAIMPCLNQYDISIVAKQFIELAGNN